MSTATQLIHELADIQRKLQLSAKHPAHRTAADRRYFSRLLAGYKRRQAKLRSLQQ